MYVALPNLNSGSAIMKFHQKFENYVGAILTVVSFLFALEFQARISNICTTFSHRIFQRKRHPSVFEGAEMTFYLPNVVPKFQ